MEEAESKGKINGKVNKIANARIGNGQAKPIELHE